MNEAKATRYHRLRRRADVLALAMSAGVLVLLAVGGGAIVFRDVAADLAARAGASGPLHARLTVACFVIFLAVVLDVTGLPAAFFRGFVLERRYGLSTGPVRDWLRDRARSSGVGLLLALAGALFIYELLRVEPERWWLLSAGGVALATVAFAHLAPVLLVPWLFRTTPLERSSLNQRLVSLARRAGTRVLGVYEWKLGGRTRRAGAVLVGVGRTRRILLSDTLLASCSDDEIEVILAHELGHHVHGDIWKAVGVESATWLVAFGCASAALSVAVPALGLAGAADVAGLPVMLLAGGAAMLALSPLANGMSRRHERRADAYALDLTGRPDAFVSAMRRLADQNLAETEPPRLVGTLLLSHPPMGDRIAAAEHWRGRKAHPEPVEG